MRRSSTDQNFSGIARFWRCLTGLSPYAPLAMLFAVALPLLTASRGADVVAVGTGRSHRYLGRCCWGVRADLIQLGLMARRSCC